MEKFIPYGKLSKKKKRELNASKRGSWGAISPVTRKSANPKAYDRKKARRGIYDDPGAPSFLIQNYELRIKNYEMAFLCAARGIEIPPLAAAR